MARRPRPAAPHPQLRRRPQGPFGWLDAALLSQGWLAELGAQPTAVLVLLALAADERGASFYGREKMAHALSIPRREIDRALERLVLLGLVAHRPWRDGHPDGVWQLLPLPPRRTTRFSTPATRPLALADLLRSLGFQPPTAE